MSIVALIVAISAFVAASIAVASARSVRRRLAAPADGDVVGLVHRLDADLDKAEGTIAGLQERVVRVEHEIPNALSRTAVLVYDAFGDIAGNLSRTIALLNAHGDGLVISLLVGRNETLFYTKQVRAERGVEELSPEELEAVERAMQR